MLATKFFFAMTATDKGLSAERIHKQLNNFLRRLRTDYVDLYQCHRFDPDTPLEETDLIARKISFVPSLIPIDDSSNVIGIAFQIVSQ